MSDANRWRGAVLGLLGSIGGLMAMRAYWQYLAPHVTDYMDALDDEPEETAEAAGDVSLFGKQYEEGESSTAALGRILYRRLAGRKPRAKESRQMLSYLVHWTYGMLQGSVQGALMRGASPIGSLVYATALWFVGDEIVVPMLGLQPGPAASSVADHLNRLGAHWAYGLGTGASCAILEEIV